MTRIKSVKSRGSKNYEERFGRAGTHPRGFGSIEGESEIWEDYDSKQQKKRDWSETRMLQTEEFVLYIAAKMIQVRA